MRSLISIDFPAPEMEPESDMWYQLSRFLSSNAAIAMQHHPGNFLLIRRYSALSATSWYFNSMTQCN